jgi:hypothetical protein
MEPSKAPENEDELRWSEMLESLRIDVECFFVILKNIFSILKYGSRFKKWEIIDNIFLTCCALYNQRLIRKGGDDPWMELHSQYSNMDLVKEAESGDDGEADVFRRMRESFLTAEESNTGLPKGMEEINDHYNDVDVGVQPHSHDERKQMLIDHFNFLLDNDKIYWARQNQGIRLYLKN